jgi:glycosyltransferase involved in cell wall biosynthesis
MPRILVHLVHEQIGAVGGIQRFDSRVMHALAQLSATRDLQLEVIALRDIPAGARVPAGVRIRTAGGSYWRLLLLLIATHFRASVSQVMIGHVRLTRYLWIAKRLFPRSRYSLFVHGIEVWPDAVPTRAQKVSRLILRFAVDEVISVSHYTVRRMADFFHIQKYHVLPNAIDIEPAQLVHPPATARKVVLSVTRLGAHDGPKGIDFALRAIALLRDRCPQILYRIVGDGVLRAGLEKLATDLDIRSHVEFSGRLSDAEVQDAFSAADVFLLPSRKEGFGIVFLEAWKYGLPVICGNVDASAEVVMDRVDGLTVDPLSAEAIAAAIEQLLADEQLRREFAANGRKKLLTLYSDDAFRQNLGRLLIA